MEVKDIIATGTLLVGSASLFYSIREYIKRGKKDRAEFFLKLRDRFKENALYMQIQSLVEADNDAELEKISAQDINRLIGFYEEIYLFSKSNFISKDVLFYMFGQYALDCYKNTVLQKKLGLENESYWQQFRAFCNDYENWKKTNPSFVFDI